LKENFDDIVAKVGGPFKTKFICNKLLLLNRLLFQLPLKESTPLKAHLSELD